MRQTDQSKQFLERLAHWQAQGLTLAEALDTLATDTAAPPMYDTFDAAAIYGVRAPSMKKKRQRSTGPEFIAVSQHRVIYTRASLCADLKSSLSLPAA